MEKLRSVALADSAPYDGTAKEPPSSRMGARKFLDLSLCDSDGLLLDHGSLYALWQKVVRAVDGDVLLAGYLSVGLDGGNHDDGRRHYGAPEGGR